MIARALWKANGHIVIVARDALKPSLQKQKQERYTKISTNGARTPGVLVASVVLVKKESDNS